MELPKSMALLLVILTLLLGFATSAKTCGIPCTCVWAFLCGYLVASLGLQHLPPGAEGSPAVAITLDQVLCLPWGYSFPCRINDLTELVELVEYL